MKTVNGLVEKLYGEAKVKMVERLKDKALYKDLMKNLLVQVLLTFFAINHIGSD